MMVYKIYAARFGLEGILRNDLADLTDVPASAVNRLRGTPSPLFVYRPFRQVGQDLAGSSAGSQSAGGCYPASIAAHQLQDDHMNGES